MTDRDLVEALRTLEGLATRASRRIATGEATTGASALAKIATIAADKRRHHEEDQRVPHPMSIGGPYENVPAGCGSYPRTISGEVVCMSQTCGHAFDAEIVLDLGQNTTNPETCPRCGGERVEIFT